MTTVVLKPPGWTTERDDLLRTLIEEGHTYTSAGEQLGVSRNAIAGRVQRLGIEPRTKSYRRPSFLKPELKHAVPPPSVVSRNPVSILDLTLHHCRFIVGEGDDGALYCAEQVSAVGESWCTGHRQLVFVSRIR